ncbi:hypothetical protein G4B88_027439 [Cannabis sativa]|uniref:Uncharacterized protein n=1 Tax=Cannabis sativa TaxID=3483 RepID=A0A7J6HSH7_CANSA|nr:hypothetical protein G4B88_027439 [Cannabis sativa]
MLFGVTNGQPLLDTYQEEQIMR